MKLAVLINIILALLAAVQAQSDDIVPRRWPSDYQFVIRSEASRKTRLCMARDNDPRTLRRTVGSMHMWSCNLYAEDQTVSPVQWGSYGNEMLFQLGNRPDLARLCLDVPGAHFDYDVRVRLWECNQSYAQMFEPVLSYPMYKQGYARYWLRSVHQSDYCLAANHGHGFHNGAPVTLQRCDYAPGPSQPNYWTFVGRDGRVYAPIWWERAGLANLTRARGRSTATESIGGAGGIATLAKNETSVDKLSRVTGLKISAQNATHVLWWEKMPEESNM